TSIANRYLEGSAQPDGLTHPAGSVVRSTPLAQHIQDLNDRIDAVEEATVGTAKLEDGAVTAAKIANQAVTAAKIADGAVTDAKIASGAGTAATIASGAVTTGAIADGAVTAAKLADWAVPRGVLGYAFRTSSFTISSSGVVDIPDLSVQVSVPAGRVLRVIGFVRSWSGPNQGDEAAFYVREGTFALQTVRVIAAKNGVAEGGSVEALIRPSAGTHTYKLSFE